MAHHMKIRHQDFSLSDQMKEEHAKYLEFPSAGIYVPPNIYKQNKVWMAILLFEHYGKISYQ